MAYYPCKPSGTIISNPQQNGFYKCYKGEKIKIPSYLIQIRFDTTTTGFQVRRE